MRTTPDQRSVWRSLTIAEKQRRLGRLRHSQQQQVARDARVLLLVRAD